MQAETGQLKLGFASSSSLIHLISSSNLCIVFDHFVDTQTSNQVSKNRAKDTEDRPHWPKLAQSFNLSSISHSLLVVCIACAIGYNG